MLESQAELNQKFQPPQFHYMTRYAQLSVSISYELVVITQSNDCISSVGAYFDHPYLSLLHVLNT